MHYEPSAPEDVGGDFYDLFPLAPGRSGFFLGDVGGKGPDAAAVTSLARYTMRTAAMLHERPVEILMDLNAALLMDAEMPMQTCTVVYGEIDIDGDAAITLAVAGHPAALLVRSHGAVEVMPAHGTLLGLFEDPVFEVCHVDLGPGDAIVIYSDGVLDTKVDGVRLDEPASRSCCAGPPTPARRRSSIGSCTRCAATIARCATTSRSWRCAGGLPASTARRDVQRPQRAARPASWTSSATWTRLSRSSLQSSRETWALTVATLM